MRCASIPARLGLLAALALPWGGCASTPRAAQIEPTRDELATFPELERVFPIDIGVADPSRAPTPKLVRDYSQPVPITAAERAVLGEPREEPDDLMAFYRPPPGPAQGVYPMPPTRLYGESRALGGPSLGVFGRPAAVGTFGVAGRNQGVSPWGRASVGLGAARTPVGIVGRPWSMNVGEAGTRTGAGRKARADW